ncbi:MAG: CBS domain-containing protein, partial [Myxococcales bacterium]|nr:CBS domain-containing protein [Myxococcales bacterium]
MSTNPTDSNRRNAEPPRAQTRGREQAIDDIMTSPLRTVLLSDPAETVAAVFVEHGISAAPVSDAQGLVVGVISKTDLVQRCYRDGQHHPEAERATAGELMTPLILGVSRATPITRAAALMAYECVHHVI